MTYAARVLEDGVVLLDNGAIVTLDGTPNTAALRRSWYERLALDVRGLAATIEAERVEHAKLRSAAEAST